LQKFLEELRAANPDVDLPNLPQLELDIHQNVFRENANVTFSIQNTLKQSSCQSSPAAQSDTFLANRRGYPHPVSDSAWFAASLGYIKRSRHFTPRQTALQEPRQSGLNQVREANI
jgi:hypothetical protein